MALPRTETTEPKEGIEQQEGGLEETTSAESTSEQSTSPKTGVLDGTTAYMLDPNNPDSAILGTDLIAAAQRGKALDEERSLRHKTENELKIRDTALDETIAELEELKQNIKLMEGLEKLNLVKPKPTGGEESSMSWYEDAEEPTQPAIDPAKIAQQITQSSKEAVTSGMGNIQELVANAVRSEFEKTDGERRAVEQSASLMQASSNARRAQLAAKYPNKGAAEIDRMVKLTDASHRALYEADLKAKAGDFDGANELIAQRDMLMSDRIASEVEAMIQKQQLEAQAEYDSQIESGTYPGMEAQTIDDVVLEKPEFNEAKAREGKEKRHLFARNRILARAKLRNARGED